MSYSDLLKDPRWQRKRLEVMHLANFACEVCGSTTATLNVHHARYVRGRMPWDYSHAELHCLCEACHRSEHGIRTAEEERERLRVLEADVELETWRKANPEGAAMMDRIKAIDAEFAGAASKPQADNDLLDNLIREKVALSDRLRLLEPRFWRKFR